MKEKITKNHFIDIKNSIHMTGTQYDTKMDAE